MNIRKGPTIFLAVVILILMSVALYSYRGLIFRDRSRSPGGRQPRQAGTRAISRPQKGSINPPAEPAQNSPEDELKNYDPKKTLSRREYGKVNPFAPFPSSRPRGRSRGIPLDKTLRDEIAEKMSPLIEVTAIFGDTAILKVDGVSKPVEAEDTVAGLKVLKIGDGEIVLLGKEEYTIKLRGEPFRVPTGEAK
jgi:hypothetical protein